MQRAPHHVFLDAAPELPLPLEAIAAAVVEEARSRALPVKRSLRAALTHLAGVLGDLLMAPCLIAPFPLFLDDDRPPPP